MLETMNSFESITIYLLILLTIIICYAPSEVLANNELHKGMMKGEEIKVAAFQVSLLKQIKSKNVLFNRSVSMNSVKFNAVSTNIRLQEIQGW